MYEYNEMIDRLKSILDIRRMSIKQLSELTAVPYRTLYKIITKETKEPSVNIMIKIAKALGMTTDELIFGNEANTHTYITKENINSKTRHPADKEMKLLKTFNCLNDIGKNEAQKRVEELTLIDKYSNNNDTNDKYITVVAARGDSKKKVKISKETIRKDLENYIPPEEL